MQRVHGPLTQLTVDFNDNILLTSLQAEDLTVSGMPATGMTIVDGNTVLFDLPVLGEGNQQIRIADGAIQDVQGTPLAEFNRPFYHDITPPRVVNSSVQEGDVLDAGNVTIAIQMSEGMRSENLDMSDFQLSGQLYETFYNAESFGYDASNTVLTLNYSGLPEDAYTLTLLSGDGQFEDQAGLNLDGETVASPIPPNRSGDGIEGGDFSVRFALDVQTAAFPTPLKRLPPAGSLIHEGDLTGLIGSGGDTDSFTLDLDPGQTITIVAEPSATRPFIQWRESVGGNGHFYTLTSSAVDFATAELQANALGGHLVSITSAEEQAFIEANFLSGDDIRQIYWIGANDIAVEGDFEWTSGEPFVYSNWAEGEPNNSGEEDVVHINYHFVGKGFGCRWHVE